MCDPIVIIAREQTEIEESVLSHGPTEEGKEKSYR